MSTYAAVAIVADGGYSIGYAEENVPGYSPTTYNYATYREAVSAAAIMNERLGLSKQRAMDIVTSSMKGRVSPAVHVEERIMSDEELAGFVKKVQDEILDDIAQEVVPATVGTFSELHDYVDANCYGGACDDFTTITLGDFNAMSDAVDAWLRDGGALRESGRPGAGT